MSFFRDQTPLPKYWFRGNPYLTHRANAITLLFPRGEEFFVRSVRDALPRITDPQLLRNARAFAAQESQHSRAHTEHFELLRTHGFDFDGVMEHTRRQCEWTDKHFSLEMRLAITCAAEHFTAMVARELLGRERDFFNGIDARVRSMFRWHCLEELEHKAVAFNVMKAIGVSERVRLAGGLIEFFAMMGFWKRATHILCKQDGLSPEALDEGRRIAMREGDSPDREFLKRYLEYFKPRFHPDQHDDRALIEKVALEFDYARSGRA